MNKDCKTCNGSGTILKEVVREPWVDSKIVPCPSCSPAPDAEYESSSLDHPMKIPIPVSSAPDAPSVKDWEELEINLKSYQCCFAGPQHGHKADADPHYIIVEEDIDNIRAYTLSRERLAAVEAVKAALDAVEKKKPDDTVLWVVTVQHERDVNAVENVLDSYENPDKA